MVLYIRRGVPRSNSDAIRRVFWAFVPDFALLDDGALVRLSLRFILDAKFLFDTFLGLHVNVAARSFRFNLDYRQCALVPRMRIIARNNKR